MKKYSVIQLLICLLAINQVSIAQEQAPSSIQTFLNTKHEAYGLKLSDVEHWEVTDDYISKQNGIRHIYIAQSINGIALVNGVGSLALNEKDSVLYFGNSFSANSKARRSGALSPSISAESALTAAAKSANMEGSAGREIKCAGSHNYKFEKGSLSLEDITVKLRFWDNGESINLVWIVSLYEKGAAHWWQVYIDAASGQELNRLDWVKHCDFEAPDHSSAPAQVLPRTAMPMPPGTDQYHVFALPVESPTHGAISLEVGPSLLSASPFGWHDTSGTAGAEFTITRGNNAYAYEDASGSNAPGYSPSGGALLDFNFPLNLNQNPSLYRDVSITNLFYVNNRIHDILWMNGFDETSGNFQANNYGNGGRANDFVLAEAQDGGGLNNANFATPPDGFNPRMQMYLWSFSNNSILQLNSPASLAGTYSAAGAAFGPGLTAVPITADLVLVDDGTAPDINDACDPIINGAALNGKIAVLNRGICAFTQKVEAAQSKGAIAVIVINNVAGAPFVMGGTSSLVTIPSIMISQADGAAFLSAMSSGPVNASLQDSSNNVSSLDGSLDNGIIIHEYAHGISNRLTGGPLNSGCLNNDEQMGEGWSDFFGYMLTMDTSAANPVRRPIGTYAVGETPSGTGIRPAPYDTSFSVNNYTYADLANSGISVPHGVGFIWATMLWDLNWAFINQYGFDANLDAGTGGNNMVLKLVIEGLKLQNCNPGFVDGRDAILQADQILNGGVNHCLIWRTFAKRGLGFSASQGSSSIRTDQVAAYDLPNACQVPIGAPTAAFTANTTSSCSGAIQFQDLSTGVPQSWLWDFGDGTTDTIQDPLHIYTAGGFYTVTLTATNTFGANVSTVVNYIQITKPSTPLVVNGNGCPTDSILLSASASNLIHWTDLNGNFLDTGSVFYAPASTSSSSYYAVNVASFPKQKIGAVNTAIGPGGNHGNAFIGALNFDAQKEVQIYSAFVVSGAIGMRNIKLRSGYNQTGNVIDSININIPFTGPGRIDLNLKVPGPGQYSLGLNNANLFRNSSGASYPYTIPGLMSIVSSSATTGAANYYYYLYDIEVGEPDCVSDSALVTAIVASSNFSFSTAGRTVNFTDLSVGATSYFWDFGDGDTSTAQNPTHTYAVDGSYTVSLTVNGACSSSNAVNVTSVGLGSNKLEDLEIALFPNPANNETRLFFNQPLKKEARLKLYGAEGRLLRDIAIAKGSRELRLSLDDLAPQVYFLVFSNENGELHSKLVVQH